MSSSANAAAGSSKAPDATLGKKKKSDKKAATAAAALPPLPPPKLSDAKTELFAQSLMKKCLASVALSSGFTVAEGGALNALTSVAIRSVIDLGRELKWTAESSKRKLVSMEDFAAVVHDLKEPTAALKEPLRIISNVPSFPYERMTRSKVGQAEQDLTNKRLAGLSHFPSLPSEHTYKRTRIEATEPSTAEIAEMKRTQQQNSVLVRESLARLRNQGIS